MRPETRSYQRADAESTRAYREELQRDLALLDTAALGIAGFRVSWWDSPVVILGHAQPLDDVDLRFCRHDGIEVVRRGSGGKGAIHHGDLTVSLALPVSHPWAGGIRPLYRSFTGAVAQGLHSLGVPATGLQGPGGGPDSPVCFEHHGVDGLYIGNRRVFGSAQIRRRDAVLIHGTLLMGFDAELHAAVFGVSADGLKARIAGVGRGLRRSEVASAIAQALQARLAAAEATAGLLERHGGRVPAASTTLTAGGRHATNNHL